MFLRSTLITLPRITHTNVVRTCTQQITSKHTEPAESDWKTIYKFPAMPFIAKFSKLKILQSAFTAVGVPVMMGLESFQLVPVQSTELFAILGITGTISLSIYSLCAKNIIGFAYVNPTLRKIRFAYIDFWGRRQHLDITLKELVSSNRKRVFNVYTVVKTTTAVGSFKLLKFGEVLDSDMFRGIFGDV